MDNAEEQVSELDNFGGLDRVVKLNGAVAGRILEGTHRSGKQIGDRLPFAPLCARVTKNAILRVESLPHQVDPDELVR